ncbi:twitch domain-containing radical SAM protein [Bdellovibrio sp. HCB2-146]|uniref:twitch domain-containing radical SAM protein n=1 Tax=Bdellovibrio sp. HCB2-146 TaxID=3394362 RepID=UPI0039BCB041
MPERIHPDQITPTFCILPWIHLSTRPNGHMRLCCTANASSAGATNDKQYGGEVGILKTDSGKPANLGQTRLLDAWNGPYMRKVRQMMLNGEKPPSCLKCFKEESAGHRSKRIWETEYWSSRIDTKSLIEQTSPDGEVPPQIAYIDLRLGTLCNLKCIMCSPHDSSRWVGDWNKLYPMVENPQLKETIQWPQQGKVDGASYTWFADNPSFWTDLQTQLPHLQQLYFAGGESTIIQEHYTLLEKCIAEGHASKIELRYNSNGLEMPEKIFELWKHFRRVRFHFSIDSIGEMNHYIRFPSDWAKIEKQLRRLDESEAHIEVTVACAVQILNIYYIPDFIKWKLSQGYKKINPWPLGAGLINFHFVYHPAHLNVKVLPPEFKKQVTEKYEEFYRWLHENHPEPQRLEESEYGIKRLKGLVKFMNSEDWSNRLPEFKEYIQHMDKIRNLNFGETFPEMKGLVY